MILISCSGEKFSRWYWRQQILWLSWSSQQVGSCLSESVIVGASVRMRSRDLFLNFIILWIWVEELYLIWFCFTQARYFFQQLICGVSYCHHMVRTRKQEYCYNNLHPTFLKHKWLVCLVFHLSSFFYVSRLVSLLIFCSLMYEPRSSVLYFY